jgi:hypothetical protein
MISIHESVVVYDIHSYNHQREGQGKIADPSTNPDVNLGTANMNREVWESVVSATSECFKRFDYNGRTLDVRENIKFKGGYFGKWLFEQYADKICPISIEFKKLFMDEQTGKGFENEIILISDMVHASVHHVLKTLKENVK